MSSTATEWEAPVAGDVPVRSGERLAMLTAGLFPNETRIDFGVQTAVRGFLWALFQHGTLPACDLFSAPTEASTVQEQLAPIANADARPMVCVRPLETLSEYFRSHPPLVVHDPSGELVRAHYLRAQVAPGAYPITTTHYTVSYPRLRHDTFLPLLLAGYRPYDAIVCHGRAACTAVAALISQLQESLAAEYGLHLPFRGRLEAIPLGVSSEQYQPRDRAGARAQLGLPQQKLIILSLARFSILDKMDLAPLLQVFRELKRATRRRLLLVLAGSDPFGYAASIQTQARELGLLPDVCFLPNLLPLVSPVLYSAADIFVSIPDNVQEMFGQTPLEAMAAGLPVVVSDWSGYQETVIHGETGFRVPVLWARCDADLGPLAPLMPWLHDHALLAQSVAVDCQKLFDSLRMLIESEELRRKMGENGRLRVRSEYEWKRVIERYERLWRELSEQACRSPEPEGRSLGFLRPDYTGAFGHFATTLLVPERRLQLTRLGQQVLKGKQRLRCDPFFASCFDPQVLLQTLAVLRAAGRFRRSVAVGTVLRRMGKQHGLGDPAAQRHLLWLIKHGFVAAGGE